MASAHLPEWRARQHGAPAAARASDVVAIGGKFFFIP
jgi:hypothetical protein